MSVQGVNISPIKVPNQNMADYFNNVSQAQTPQTNTALAPPMPAVNLEQQNTQKQPQKPDLLKYFETKVKNTCDMNDTIQVPRTIFKGYLSFMVGTALAAINGLIKVGEDGANKKLKTGLAVASTLISLFGTWSFVRPYVIKDSQKKD